MGGMFRKPKAPDTSALLRQQKEAEERAALERRQQDDLRNRQRLGRKSLMGDSSEDMGVV